MTKKYLWNEDGNWEKELNEAWANLGEHGFDKEATYVSRDADGQGLHWLITVERRDGWDGMEPHYRVGYWDCSHQSTAQFAGQWLTDEVQQKEIDWDWTCNYANLTEMEYKTWDDLLNDNGFAPMQEQQIDTEVKSIKEHGMTRYELCWDELHSQMVKQSRTIHGGGWPVFVLDRMERIENEICGALEEEE